MYIIAEIGSNFRNESDCKDSISLAKNLGADAVKFQMFSHHDLYGYGSEEEALIKQEWLPRLAQKAENVGIDLMCTVFNPRKVAIIDKYVASHKVASSDCNYPELLSAINATGKRVFLSTGACSSREIEAAYEHLQNCEVVLMYCKADYPSKTADPTQIAAMREFFKLEVGFSDHTMDAICAPMVAMANGACAIEKHVNFFDLTSTPDAAFSLNREEFRLMCDCIKGKYKPAFMLPTEKEMLLMHKRRLVATKCISEGETLKYGVNFGAYRVKANDSAGFTPFADFSVDGKKAAVDIEHGEPIGVGMFC